MMQPFEVFKPVYIQRLIDLKKYYLVSQTYKRGVDHTAEIEKTNLIFTDYDDPGLAKIHLNAVKHDKYAALIDLRNEAHKSKITRMLELTSAYTVYWSIVKDVKSMEKRLDLRFKDNMRRYLLKNTNWRISADDNINPSFQVTFGELFIILKWRTQTLRVKFEEIEKC